MNEFQKVIKLYLDEFAGKDAEFAKRYAEKIEKLNGIDNTITHCCNYICTEVEKSGRQGFADSEIYGMAVHFIDELELTAQIGAKGHVVVNHSIELTEADKDRLRKEAEAEYKRDVRKAIVRDALAEKAPAPKKEKVEKLKKKPQHEEVGLLFSFDD